MAQTIGNPLSWLAQHFGSASAHVSDSISHLRGDEAAAPPEVQTLTLEDLRESLKAGLDDFAACRTDAMFLILCYPLIGLALVVLSLQVNLLPLIFPLILGFALVGPAASVGLYQMSARRAAGHQPRWSDALSVLRSPALLPILTLSGYLAMLFVGWLLVAYGIYNVTLGPESPASASAFLASVFLTAEGWTMIILGDIAGAAFAIAALLASIVSFQLLLDRSIGLPLAVATSMRLVRKNPVTCLSWGAFVAIALLLGSLPAFAGLIVVIPVLGHASWHLYRRAVK